MIVSPEIVIVGGPNGAGKTTFARQLLPALYPEIRFINVDEIQRSNDVFDHPISAGKEMLRRLSELEKERHSFALETTLSSRMYAKHIPRWQARGYSVSLHFIEAPSPDFAVKRVAARVAAGGHHIPEADVRRRFSRGLSLFHSTYKPIVDEWYHWMTSTGGLSLVESQKL